MKVASAAAQKPEKEILAPVDICLPNGRLNPSAVGWSRFPMHRDNLRGWGRNKRFEYWCIVCDDFVITANISHHDYRANIASTFIDLKRDETISYRINRWLPPGNALPDPTDRAPMRGDAAGISVQMLPNDQGTQLRVQTDRIELDAQVVEPEGHESMGVLVPWDDRRFQYTRKDNCLPAQGVLRVDGVEHRIDPQKCLALHDVGRGRWPYSTWWNWAGASGVCDGEMVGLQFGGKWTEGSPSTENSLRLGGRIHKISEELDWLYDPGDFRKPWKIRGSAVDLVFTPTVHHHHFFNRWVISARGDQCFGHFSGEVLSGTGKTYRIRNLFGMAEEVHRKW